MGKEADLRKQAQNLQSQINGMKNAIANYEPEYKAKKEKLDQLNQEIGNLRTNIDEIKDQYKSEIKDQIEKDLAEKIELTGKMHVKALEDKEEADRLKKAELAKTKELIEYEKNKKKEISDLISAQKKEADDYFATTKKEADKYLLEKKNEISLAEKDIESRSKELDKLESDLRKKEHSLASLQIELSKKEEDAKFGFKTLLLDERKKFDEELEKLKISIADLEKKLIEGKAIVDDHLKTYRENEIKKIANEIEHQKNEIKISQNQLVEMKARLDAQQTELSAKSDELKIQADIYKTKFSNLNILAEEKLKEFHNEIIISRDNYKKKCNELSSLYDDANKKVLDLTTQLKLANGERLDSLQNENKALKERLEVLENSEKSVINKLREYQVDSSNLVSALYKIEAYDSLLEKYEILNKESQQLRLRNAESTNNEETLAMESKRANQYQQNYNQVISELERMKKPSRKDRLSSLTKFNDFDHITNLEVFPKNLTEITWLRIINKKMRDSGIIISDKLLYAFHTSVKIHEWSPIVVLAGVSGTGKSELPRQYAHHGGMNFLSTPVKPDWDSMQSLFGYYNSIENKYEPTELTKAIYYLQSDLMKDTMLLILLDEMNLAYVELYFSDLLSKFETNRGTNGKIIYDINLGANEQPEKLIIGNNILWVGTMNEDETTKALSDKVIDRSTLLTFPRPRTLVSRKNDIKIADPEKRLTSDLWKKWCQNTLSEEDFKNKLEINFYRKIIEDINDQMSRVNRNLGHRVWQSIERYVFSHPLVFANIENGIELKKTFDSAFAEAIAFKVMPKLRGIEVSGESKKTLESIGAIIAREVPSLEEDYKQAMNLTSRIFQWSSARFMDTDSENGE